MWTAVEEMNMETILAVMNTMTYVVVKIRPEENSQLGGGHYVGSK